MAQEQNQITFIEEIEDSVINAIRRYLHEIPIAAVDEIEVFKNDSALYDETIAHRLGLIPLQMEKSIPEKGVKLKLVSSKEGTVYSSELKGSIKPVFDSIPITILNKGQELELVADIKVGRGSEHAKFSPGLLFYKNLVKFKTGSKAKDIQNIFSKFDPKNGVKFENNKTYEIAINDAIEQAFEELGIEVERSDKQRIYVESFGQLPVKEILLSSIKELKKDLTSVDKEIAKAK